VMECLVEKSEHVFPMVSGLLFVNLDWDWCGVVLWSRFRLAKLSTSSCYILCWRRRQVHKIQTPRPLIFDVGFSLGKSQQCTTLNYLPSCPLYILGTPLHAIPCNIKKKTHTSPHPPHLYLHFAFTLTLPKSRGTAGAGTFCSVVRFTLSRNLIILFLCGFFVGCVIVVIVRHALSRGLGDIWNEWIKRRNRVLQCGQKSTETLAHTLSGSRTQLRTHKMLLDVWPFH
jgi:hypothetical protein